MFRTNLAIDIGSMRNPRKEGTEGGFVSLAYPRRFGGHNYRGSVLLLSSVASSDGIKM